MGITATHTYVELELSQAAYDEIAAKLMTAGYQHCFPVGYEHNPGDGPIDMHGLAVTRSQELGYRCTQCGWPVDTDAKPEFPE